MRVAAEGTKAPVKFKSHSWKAPAKFNLESCHGYYKKAKVKSNFFPFQTKQLSAVSFRGKQVVLYGHKAKVLLDQEAPKPAGAMVLKEGVLLKAEKNLFGGVKFTPKYVSHRRPY